MTRLEIAKDHAAHQKLLARTRALSRPKPKHLQYEEMRNNRANQPKWSKVCQAPPDRMIAANQPKITPQRIATPE